jgi:hypothetical protein
MTSTGGAGFSSNIGNNGGGISNRGLRTINAT